MRGLSLLGVCRGGCWSRRAQISEEEVWVLPSDPTRLTRWKLANVVGHSDQHARPFHVITVFNVDLK